jgi:peroxiredoxin
MRIARHRNRGAWIAAGLLCGGLVHTGPAAADESPAEAAVSADERLNELLRHVEAEEARYERLETQIRFRSQFGPDEISSQSLPDREARWHTIVQRDLFWLRSDDLSARASGDDRAADSLVAFDGKETHVVDFRNCVNIQTGRRQPREVVSPHVWAITHFRADPLSVLLNGAEAIKSRYHHRFEWQGDNDLARLEITVEPDETIDNLECAKVRCRSWYGAGREPTVDIIWLAKEKNSICVRSQTLTSEQGVVNEGHVTEWQELKSGLWLPNRVTIKQVAPPYEEEYVVDAAKVDMAYPLSQFREIKLPDNLPVYRIDADGFLTQSAMKSQSEPRPQAELDALIAAVRREEQRYARYDVTVKAAYRKISGGMATETLQQNFLERSVAYDGRLYSEEKKSSWSADGGRSQLEWVRVYDGEWNRERLRSTSDRPDPRSDASAAGAGPSADHAWRHDQHEGASLGRGGPDAIVMFRPHTVLFNDDRQRMHRLSSFLDTPEYDEVNHYRHKIEYLGPEMRDGLDCEKLQIRFDFGERGPKSGFFLWLAKNRNYLPVYEESYDLKREPKLPQAIAYVDDLREISPGVWFPYHSVLRRFAFKDSRLLINWAYEQHVTNLSMPSRPPDGLFELNVPAGVSVSIFTGKRRQLGRITQVNDGPASIREAKWQAMLLADPVDWAEQQNRKKALAALVGQPAPAMPEMEWLQGGPFSADQLRGRTVLLVFWAEWQYPESVFRTLVNEARNLSDAGVVVIGVHPRGSEPDEVLGAVDAASLKCNVAIDAKGSKEPSWGAWHERFGLKQPTHAFVIDRDGKIAAEGDLGKLVRQAIQTADQ